MLPFLANTGLWLGIYAPIQVLLPVSPTWSLALAAAPLLGAGFGMYWAAALLTQVLPAAAGRGEDVGLINLAYNLPPVVAPLAARVLLGLVNSYPAFFALAGIVTIMAAWTVGRTRSAT